MGHATAYGHMAMEREQMNPQVSVGPGAREHKKRKKGNSLGLLTFQDFEACIGVHTPLFPGLD